MEAFKRRGNDMSVVAVFLGYGPYGDVIKKKAGNAPNIYFHPKVGQDVYMDYVASADIGIHLMENTCLNHDFALPNKLFEYAMAGIPVIVSNMREMGGFVRANKIGYVLDKNDADHLGGVLEQVAKDDLAQFGPALKQVSQSFNWEAQEKKFVAIYRGLVPAQAGL